MLMKSSIGDVRLNPYGYYLSWEIDMGCPSYPEIWGGNTSALYNIFHCTIEAVLGETVLACGNSYLKAYRWSTRSSDLLKLLRRTELGWRALFGFFAARNMTYSIAFKGGKLGIVALNVTENDQPYQKTLTPIEREEVVKLLKNLYAMAAET